MDKFNLIQIRKGKETVYMTDELTKVRDRMKTLRQSQRTDAFGAGLKGQKVEYIIRETEETIKFKKKPPGYIF